MTTFTQAADRILTEAVLGTAPVAGVVAMVTDAAGVVYAGAAGVRRLDRPIAMTPDTVFALSSTAWAVTGTVALQLAESGDLDLDAPITRYAPDLAPDGDPAPERAHRGLGGGVAPTTRHLLERGAADAARPGGASAGRADDVDPLVRVVEGVTGRPVDEVLTERVLAPLGMHDTGFALTEGMRRRLAGMHGRASDGTLTLTRPAGRELFGTVHDFLRFLRMWLNDGRAADGTPVLRSSTVATVTHPGGLGWAGRPNVFCWLDRENGVAGFWATQVLPFGDPTSLLGYRDLTSAWYATHPT